MPNFSPARTLGRGMPIAGVPRAAPVASPLPGSSQSKRARKDRGPNWLPQEIFALISAKREMFLEELDTIDGRDLMTPETTKWHRVAQCLMRSGYSPCLRDGPACKTKWNQLIPDYKKIADYLSRTGRNAPDYWDLSSAERKSEGLPRLFGQDVFDAIHEWYGSRPQFNHHILGTYSHRTMVITDQDNTTAKKTMKRCRVNRKQKILLTSRILRQWRQPRNRRRRGRLGGAPPRSPALQPSQMRYEVRASVHSTACQRGFIHR